MQRKAIKETPISILGLNLPKCSSSVFSKCRSIFKRDHFVPVYTETGNRKKWELERISETGGYSLQFFWQSVHAARSLRYDYFTLWQVEGCVTS